MAPSLTPQHPAIHSGDANAGGPVVLNIRRPKALQTGSPRGVSEEPVLATVVDDTPLPPTMMRLPNLAERGDTSSSRWSKASSIAHWVAIGLGGLIAVWLIFGGRGKPLPDTNTDTAPGFTTPVRADAAAAAPAWVPPPLESAGDSSAPRWTPPAAAPQPKPAPEAQKSESKTQPSAAKSPSESPAAVSAEHKAGPPAAPRYEEWPKSEASPAAAPPVENASTPPVETSAQQPADAGPVLRTAQREMPPASTASQDPTGDAQPLGITVAVPQ